jgi:hypothetical protein
MLPSSMALEKVAMARNSLMGMVQARRVVVRRQYQVFLDTGATRNGLVG